MTSPTARTLEALRKLGCLCQVVEHWNAFSRRRIDLYGIIDVVAIRADVPGVTGIQATSTANLTARVKKALAEPALLVWLQAGNRFSCWGWAKRGKKGERKVWTLKEVHFAVENNSVKVMDINDGGGV